MKTLKRIYRSTREYITLPSSARKEAHRDYFGGLPGKDPGIDECIAQAVGWLCLAQDNSSSADGGVARHYSLVSGWSSSYPETTGYIIPTLLHAARLENGESLRQRARRMLDWLVSIQFTDGGFQGGTIGQEPRVPVIFNTGQILLGLASGKAEFGDDYLEPMRRAAQWLVDAQDPDGCWRKHATPFARPGEKAYETHVAWGLFEAARHEPDRGFAEAAMSNIAWALKHQRDNGWIDSCCLENPDRPLTHTLGYFLRGVLEAYRYANENKLLEHAILTADGLLGAYRADNGYLAGRLDSEWRPAVKWSCLTGSAQIAYCWLLLYQYTGDDKYFKAASAANRYVRRTMRIDGQDGIRGGVKGSFPVYGAYGKYSYLNWAAKFTVDSILLEKELSEVKGNT